MAPHSSALLQYWTSPLWSGALLKDSTSLYHCGGITWPFVESTSTSRVGLRCVLGNHQKMMTPRHGEQSGAMSSRLQPHSTPATKRCMVTNSSPSHSAPDSRFRWTDTLHSWWIDKRWQNHQYGVFLHQSQKPMGLYIGAVSVGRYDHCANIIFVAGGRVINEGKWAFSSLTELL